MPAPNPRPVAGAGAIESTQEAEITLAAELLERIWTIDNLELLARAYWAFLRRFTFGAIRVVYGARSRTITAFGRVPLLRFGPPAYELDRQRGEVRWTIQGGLLVAREGRGKGYLSVSVRRLEHDESLARVRAKVTVGSFYPGIRGRGRFARLGAWIYGQTQLRVHVLVCNAYLRSLARMRLPAIERAAMPSDETATAAIESKAR